jgi:hypothetical protein
MKQISINVMDMSKDDILSTFMIAPVIQSQQLFNAEPKRADGMSVILDCPEERALAIVGVIRMKYGKNEFRCYEGKKRI